MSSITFEINDRKIRRVGPFRLPYLYSDTNIDDIDGAYPVAVSATADSRWPGTKVSCTIVERGISVSDVTATGPRSKASCSDHQPQNPIRRPHREAIPGKR